MKYPIELELRIPEIQAVINAWPVKRDVHEVLSWILQFDEIDYEIAINIIKNLNVIGPDDLNAALSIAYSKLQRHATEKGHKISKENTIFVTFGSAAKSGSLIAYNFRCVNGLASESFMTEESVAFIKEGKIKNLVLIDDIIGTGEQSSELLANIAEKAHSLNIHDIYVLTAFGFKEGIKRISETQLADVFAAIQYGKEDTVTSLDSMCYEGFSYEKRISVKDKLANKYLGLGHKGMGALIVFYYNTPNNTIRCVWSNQNGWIPLFERKSDVAIQNPEKYTLEELLEKPIEVEKLDKSECNIYVEGKLEELFIQELANQNNQFGYSNVNVISIGPFYNKNLIQTLTKLADNIFFVTTEPLDSTTAHANNIKDALGDTEVLRIAEVMKYFSMEKICASETFLSVLDWDSINENEVEDYKLGMIENKLFKKAVPTYRLSNMKELVANCLDDGMKTGLIELFTKKK